MSSISPLSADIEDSFEENDTFETAYEVTYNMYSNLYVYSNDDDWYKVWAEVGNYLKVFLWFNHNTAGDLKVEFYNSNHEIVESVDSKTNDEQCVHYVESSGYYYILIKQQTSDVRGSYRLEVLLNQDDRFEENNDFESAKEIEFKEYNLLYVYYYNPDWYKIALEKGTGCRIDVLFDHDFAGDLKLEVYNHEKGLIQTIDTPNHNEEFSIRADDTEYYYLKIIQQTKTGANGYYVLKITNTTNQLFEVPGYSIDFICVSMIISLIMIIRKYPQN